MTFLTYWYGTDSFDQAFTFQKGETLISHDQGIEKGFLDTLNQQINSGKMKLTKAVKTELIKGIEEYNKAIKLPPDERPLLFGAAVEAHDLVLTEEFKLNMAQIEGESGIYDRDEENVKQAPKSKKFRVKEAGKSKKVSKNANSESKAVTGFSDEMNFAENEDTDHDSDAAVGKLKKAPEKAKNFKQAKTKKSAVSKSKSTGVLTDEMSFAEDEIETDEENEKSYSETDDDDDFDFTATKRIKGKARKATEKSVTKAEKAKPKEIKVAEVQVNESKASEKKSKIDRKRKKKEGLDVIEKESIAEPVIKKMKIGQGDQTRYRQEQNDYEKCELKYGELIVRWQVALEEDSSDSVDSVFDELTKEVAQMSAPFIETCEIAALLKKSKSFFESEARKERYSKLKAVLKEHYNKMKARVPEGFVPRKLETPISSDKEINVGPLETGIKAPNLETQVPGVETSSTDIRGSIDIISTLAKKEFVLVTPKSERISSLETKSADRGLEKKAAPQPAKMARMSLGSMLKTQSSSQPGLSTAPVQSSFENKATPKLSAWLTAAPETNGCLNDTRSLAMEFFKEAATRFDPEKLKPESIVRAIEKAVYVWSRSQTDEKKADVIYWEKVHAIVAGICGKDEQPGSLMSSISNGFFASPSDIATLSIDTLVNHFLRCGP